MEAENIITSRQNPLISRIASLSERKYRERARLFRFDGTKLFSEAVFAGSCCASCRRRGPLSPGASRFFGVAGRVPRRHGLGQSF